MDKKLALAFDFVNAPAEVKEAAEVHRENWLRLEKAEAQVKRWIEERNEALSAHKASSRRFDSALKAWDPAETKDPKLEEKAKKEKGVE